MVEEPSTNLGDLAVRWQHFRGLVDTGWLDIRPVTLLIGRNNSGKTSVLAPLLLLKQSLQSSTGTNALMTRGELMNLGSFVDVVQDHDHDASFSFGLRWHSHPPSPDTRPIGEYPPGGLELRFAEAPDPAFIDLAEYTVYDYYRRKMLGRKLRRKGRSYSLSLPAARAFPESAGDVSAVGGRNATAVQRMQQAMWSDRPTDFLFTATRTRRVEVPSREDEDGPHFPLPTPGRDVLAYNQVADFVVEEVERLLDSLYFIGPLREPPQRIYTMSGEMPQDVGARGELAPQILSHWTGLDDLWGEVHEWLRRFDFGATLECRMLSEEAFALYVCRANGARPTSILDMGFGISQVLPLIVQALMPGRSSRLIVQQPEIHLNPALQSVLADLFVMYAGRGNSVIAETHSEHVLLRLRTLVADKQIDHRDVAVYFVSETQGVSHVNRVAISETGHIEAEDWPEGFFADGLRESFELVAAQSRARSADAN